MKEKLNKNKIYNWKILFLYWNAYLYLYRRHFLTVFHWNIYRRHIHLRFSFTTVRYCIFVIGEGVCTVFCICQLDLIRIFESSETIHPRLVISCYWYINVPFFHLRLITYNHLRHSIENMKPQKPRPSPIYSDYSMKYCLHPYF